MLRVLHPLDRQDELERQDLQERQDEQDPQGFLHLMEKKEILDLLDRQDLPRDLVFQVLLDLLDPQEQAQQDP